MTSLVSTQKKSAEKFTFSALFINRLIGVFITEKSTDLFQFTN
jgi:hypothetical protein